MPDPKLLVRFDAGEIDSRTFLKTPEGFLIVTGYPTRVGVFKYLNADGSIRRELRHPDEVCRADSLQSLAGKPLTIRKHPTSLVTPQTVQKEGVGSSTNEIHVVGDGLIKVVYNVHRQDGIDGIESGECRQLSCGYSCGLDWSEPGVYKGERFDARQVNITYNHTTALAAGRAGPECGLHMDGVDDDRIAYQVREDSGIFIPQPKVFRNMARINPDLLDGVIHSDADAEMPAALATEITRKLHEGRSAKERADSLETELAKVRADMAELQRVADGHEGRADRMEEEVVALQERLNLDSDDKDADDEEGDMDEEEMPAFMKKKGKAMKKDAQDGDSIADEVQSRLDAIQEGLAVLDAAGFDISDVKFDSSCTAIEIRQAVVEACKENLNLDNASDDTINARFDALVEELSEMQEADEGSIEQIRGDSEAFEHSKVLEAVVGLSRRDNETTRRNDQTQSAAKRKDMAYQTAGPLSKRK